jgi:hypothetical protein
LEGLESIAGERLKKDVHNGSIFVAADKSEIVLKNGEKQIKIPGESEQAVEFYINPYLLYEAARYGTTDCIEMGFLAKDKPIIIYPDGRAKKNFFLAMPLM